MLNCPMEPPPCLIGFGLEVVARFGFRSCRRTWTWSVGKLAGVASSAGDSRQDRLENGSDLT